MVTLHRLLLPELCCLANALRTMLQTISCSTTKLINRGVALGESSKRHELGRVYLVGAGPGSIDLLTVGAARLLQQADAVVYDRLVGKEILDLIATKASRFYVGKSSGRHSVPQAQIGELMVRLAGEGKQVVRLKGGDPGIFGRMGEELTALAQAGVTTKIIPGITAASGAAAAMGIALTDRAHAQQVRFITARQCSAAAKPDWADLARQDETLVFYMGRARIAEICTGLRAAGLPDTWPVMLVANASLAEQQSITATLASLPQLMTSNPLPSPCLAIVGNVVQMAAAHHYGSAAILSAA